MKKTLVFATALTIIFSCTEKVQEGVPQQQTDMTTEDSGPWKVILEAGPDAVTKSYLGEKNTVRFSSTDTLAVFAGYAVDYLYGSEFTVKDGRIYDDGSADFEGELPRKSEPYLVMYPHRTDEVPYIEKYGQAQHLRFSIPQEQKATVGSYDPAAAVSMGLAEELGNGNLKVTLSNCCALAKFTMPEGSFSKVELYSNVNPDDVQSAEGTHSSRCWMRPWTTGHTGTLTVNTSVRLMTLTAMATRYA